MRDVVLYGEIQSGTISTSLTARDDSDDLQFIQLHCPFKAFSTVYHSISLSAINPRSNANIREAQ